jgi:hypothetical protein
MSTSDFQYEIVLVIACLLYAICSIPCMLLCYYYWDKCITTRDSVIDNQINIPIVEHANMV